jgi:hypothetical protein
LSKHRVHNAVFGFIAILWLSVTLPFLRQFIGVGKTIVFPIQPISHQKTVILIILGILLSIYSFILGINHIKNSRNSFTIKKKRFTGIFIFSLFISAPFVHAYVYQNQSQTIIQTILDLAALDEHFDDVAPGEDPTGWTEDKGSWEVVDDGGELVYYQSNDGVKDAFSIPTSGNTSWTNYTFTVDLKLVECPTNKPDCGAILAYRYSGGNDYYYIALREARDEIEVYKHGPPGGGHLIGIVSFTLVQDTWYSVNITIRSNNVWISVDDTPCFTNLDMQGAHSNGNVGIGTEYYKVMFDNIHVELL